MKKILIIAGSVVAILGAGGYAAYQYAMDMAADKLSEELTNDPELMKQIDEAVKKNEEEIAKLAEELPTDGIEGQADEAVASPSASTGGTEGQKNQASAPSAREQGSAASNEQPAKEASSTEQASTESKPSGGKEFSNRNEAVRFAMSRFSAGEMNEMRKMAADGLTAEEKAILKQKAFSNFSPEEIAAVQRALSN